MGSDIIKISHLTKNFGDVIAVNDLNFKVKRGEDMSLKQIFLLRGIELVILEISVYQAVLRLSGADVTIFRYMAIMLFTAFFDVLSYMVRWYLDMEEADFINQKIAEYHAVRNGDYTYESDRKNDTASCTRGRNTGVF